MYSLSLSVWPMGISRLVGEIMVMRRTLRSMMVSGRANSSTMQSGMAPPHGLQLSILRSKRVVSTLGALAKISAAHAPEGPPPMTATLIGRSSAMATLDRIWGCGARPATRLKDDDGIRESMMQGVARGDSS